MRYTYVRQHDTTDCAAACLAMVCLHYRKEITITRLRDMMGTDLKGTNLIGLQKAANELGFTSAAVRVDRENFLSDFSLPCIAQEITDQGLTHFVVVFKKTTIPDEAARRKHMLKVADEKAEAEKAGKKYKDKEYVIVGDPATELRKMTLDEFYKNFTGVLLLLNPTADFQPGKVEQGSMFKRYVNLLLPQKKLFAYAILSSVLLTILGIASSLFNKILMDEVLPYGLQNLLLTLVLVFSVVSITSAVITFVRQWILVHLSIKIDIPMMLGYFGHIYKLPMKFFATRKTGDITTRYSDANTIKSIFTSIALSLIMDISMAVVTGVILFKMNATLFSIALFMTLVSILLVLVYKRPYKKINEETMQQASVLNSQMIEGLRRRRGQRAGAPGAGIHQEPEDQHPVQQAFHHPDPDHLADLHRLHHADHLRRHLPSAAGRHHPGFVYGVQYSVQLFYQPGEQPGQPAAPDPGSLHFHEASD